MEERHDIDDTSSTPGIRWPHWRNRGSSRLPAEDIPELRRGCEPAALFVEDRERSLASQVPLADIGLMIAPPDRGDAITPTWWPGADEPSLAGGGGGRRLHRLNVCS